MIFVVNGQEVDLAGIDPAEDWPTLAREALLVTENVLDREWELRTEDGTLVDMRSPVNPLIRVVYVTLKLGAGGASRPSERSGIRLTSVAG